MPPHLTVTVALISWKTGDSSLQRRSGSSSRVSPFGSPDPSFHDMHLLFRRSLSSLYNPTCAAVHSFGIGKALKRINLILIRRAGRPVSVRRIGGTGLFYFRYCGGCARWYTVRGGRYGPEDDMIKDGVSVLRRGYVAGPKRKVLPDFLKGRLRIRQRPEKTIHAAPAPRHE